MRLREPATLLTSLAGAGVRGTAVPAPRASLTSPQAIGASSAGAWSRAVESGPQRNPIFSHGAVPFPAFAIETLLPPHSPYATSWAAEDAIMS
jgi:hypothetical protein